MLETGEASCIVKKAVIKNTIAAASKILIMSNITHNCLGCLNKKSMSHASHRAEKAAKQFGEQMLKTYLQQHKIFSASNQLLSRSNKPVTVKNKSSH